MFSSFYEQTIATAPLEEGSIWVAVVVDSIQHFQQRTFLSQNMSMYHISTKYLKNVGL